MKSAARPGWFSRPPWLPLGLAGFILIALMVICSGCYTLKQGVTLLGYLNRAAPLESLLDAPGATPEEGEQNRRFVRRVQDIRRFAREELGLKESGSYTRYVRLDRDYLAAVVSASAPDSFERYQWWFPLVGGVPYKGFFAVEDARREARKLKKKGLDVWIREVDAFSTLGWFPDPLYSYMREYPPHRLAELIIHETLHGTVYLKGQSQFDEELAEFVGREGGRLYMERRFGLDSPEYRDMLDSQADNGTYIGFIQSLIKELDGLYGRSRAQGLDSERLIHQKGEIIKAAQLRFDREYDALFHSDAYRPFARLPVNNAYLELFRLYYSGGEYLEDLYQRSGRNLRAFIAAAKTLKNRGGPGRDQLERALRSR